MNNLSSEVIRFAHGNGDSGMYYIFIYRSSPAIRADDHDASRDLVIQHCRNFISCMRSMGEAKGRITIVAISATSVISGFSPSFCTNVDLEVQMPLDVVPQSITSDKAQQAGIRAINRTVTKFTKVIGAHIIHALTRGRTAVVVVKGTNVSLPAG